MVERPEDSNDNEQVAPDTATRKRSRLFGARRTTRKSESAPETAPAGEQSAQDASAEHAPEPATPEPAGKTSPATTRKRTTGSRAAKTDKAGDAGKPGKAEKAADKVAEAEPAPAQRTDGLPATSILFQAPPELPPAPKQEAEQVPSRRRSRKRSGDDRQNDDQPEPKARQPKEQPEPITEPQKVKGSTRLEAKKQRRRDGRDAGRRRQVITEAEFLARRESVDRVMVVRSKNNLIQLGVLEDGVLVEH